MSMITKVFGGFKEIMNNIYMKNWYEYYLDTIKKKDVYKTFGNPNIDLGIEHYWVFRIGVDYFCIDKNMIMYGTNHSLYQSICDYIYYKSMGIRYVEINAIDIKTSEHIGEILKSNTYSLDLTGYSISHDDIYKTFGNISDKYFFSVSDEHFYIFVKDSSIELKGTNSYMYGAITDYIYMKSNGDTCIDYVDLVKGEEEEYARIIQRNCHSWIWKPDCADGTNGIYMRLNKNYFDI